MSEDDDRDAERPSEREPGRSDNGATDRSNDRSAEQSNDRSTEQSNDRSVDQSKDRSTEVDDAEGGSFTFVDDAVAVGETAAPESGRPGETNAATSAGEPDAVRGAEERPRTERDERAAGADATTGESGGPDRSDAEEPGADAPLADLARDVSRRRAERGSDSGADDESELFEEVDVGDVDTDALWEDLADVDDERPPGALDAVATTADVASPPTEHVIPKRAYCQRCRYFADPPAVACTHEGTEIVELTDSDHFRVRSCPMAGDESREFE